MNEKAELPTAPLPLQGQSVDAPPPYSPYPSLPKETGQVPPVGLAYPAPMAQPIQPTVVQVTHVPPNLTVFGPESIRLMCPHCQADVSSRVDKDPSIAAYVSAAILCIIGCSLGCCLVPFCIDSCQTSEHYCPNCKKFLGRYSRY